ncbi:hypothetical protein Ct61P_12486 [Colletotrichum tofieldiae]|nr:hypothetical protein Ct61P_12486 [Colletotrichum tofieldiae]
MCQAEENAAAEDWKTAGVDVLQVIKNRIEPWDIPSQEDVLQLAAYVWARMWKGKGTASEMIKEMLTRNRSRYRLSAASLAIHFLGSLPLGTRRHIRNVVLHEDRQPRLDPACHARGLIPFCQENLLLRIERRANLWWNVFQQQHSPRPQMRVRDTSPEKMTLFSKQVTKEVAVWIVEASILTSIGMSPGSFSLVLDAGPAPQLAEALFQQVVQRDVAWHLARDEAIDWGYLLRLSWVNRRRCRFGGYTYESFPQAMQDIASQRSVVRLTFDVGNPANVDELVERNRAYDHNDWVKKWESHKPKSWKTVEPLPSWKQILMDNVVSWEEIRRLRMEQ